MIIEYYNYDIASNDGELRNYLIEAYKFYPNTISVLPQSLKLARSIVGNNFSLSCPIDYPLGCSDLDSRMSMINYAIKNSANKIDMLLPTNAICNRKYAKLKEELARICELAVKNNISFRYILEYRTFNYETLYKVCKILSTNSILEVFPSSGFGLDSIYDNILASSMITKKVPTINIINTGNIWSEKQIDEILALKLYGIRTSATNVLDILQKKLI